MYHQMQWSLPLRNPNPGNSFLMNRPTRVNNYISHGTRALYSRQDMPYKKQ